jgi:general secretion pathway protein F
LLDWGKFATANMGTVLLALTLVLVSVASLLYRQMRAGGVARLLVHLPGVGERVRIYELSRLYLTLGMLLEGGITLVTAMETVQNMVSSGIKSSLQNAKEHIQSGTQLSIAFETNHLTTPISLRMLRVGERTGDLGAMLTQSAAFYDDEISRWIDRFTRSFEPLLMAGIGIVVGAIVVLLYMPIFDLAGSLS